MKSYGVTSSHPWRFGIFKGKTSPEERYKTIREKPDEKHLNKVLKRDRKFLKVKAQVKT